MTDLDKVFHNLDSLSLGIKGELSDILIHIDNPNPRIKLECRQKLSSLRSTVEDHLRKTRCLIKQMVARRGRTSVTPPNPKTPAVTATKAPPAPMTPAVTATKAPQAPMTPAVTATKAPPAPMTPGARTPVTSPKAKAPAYEPPQQMFKPISDFTVAATNRKRLSTTMSQMSSPTPITPPTPSAETINAGYTNINDLTSELQTVLCEQQLCQPRNRTRRRLCFTSKSPCKLTKKVTRSKRQRRQRRIPPSPAK